MNPMESNPAKKVFEHEAVDRISDLIDPILETILHYLPTKNVVATSVLSTRWKNLSPFAVVPIKLELDDSTLLRPKRESTYPSSSFVDFVDKLLNRTLSDVPCVEDILLVCKKHYSDAKILSWVRAALLLNVQVLSLSLHLRERDGIFVGLNGCTTLVGLTLELELVLCLPDDFSLPNLKSLHLSRLIVNYEYRSIFRKLIKGCPILEDLWLTNCTLTGLSIMSPRLKSFKMEDRSTNWSSFVLCTPNLEVLELNKNVPWRYYVSELKSPRAALIDVDQPEKAKYCYRNDITQLVIACSNTISLYLAARSISALCCSTFELPDFQNLTRLSLGHIGVDGWALLASLLQKAPNLEELNFKEGFTENGDGFANFQKSLSVSPVSVDMHMKKIEFSEFRGNEDEKKLVEYFLKNGDVLQIIVLNCVSLDDTTILKRFLMSLPRRSNACEIFCRSK